MSAAVARRQCISTACCHIGRRMFVALSYPLRSVVIVAVVSPLEAFALAA